MLPALSPLGTFIAFVAVIGVGIGGLLVMPIEMTQETVLTMVLPSMVIYGGIMVVIGTAHGLYRAG